MQRLLDGNSADKACQTAADKEDMACQTEAVTTADVGCQSGASISYVGCETDVEQSKRRRLRDVSGLELSRMAGNGEEDEE